MKIGIVSEDVCSLPEKMIRDFGIEIVKTKLYFPEWEKFPEKNLYQLMMETKATPKTSAPPPGDYLRAYKKVLKNHEVVLVITLSSKLSACYNSAFQAREIFENPEKVFILDSLQAVAAQGLLVLKAVELIKRRKKINEILEVLEKLKRKIKLFGFLRTTYWAEKIGRINKKLAFAFTALRILGVYPYFGTKEGKIGFSGFNFWTYDEFEAIFNQLKHQAKRGKIKVGINYTDNVDIALRLKEKLEKNLNAEVLFVSMAPPIVGANSGPGTLIAACYNIE
jgi:DegV family protein with EDD domain